MRRVRLASLILLAAALAVTGCSNKPKLREPAKLVAIDKPVLKPNEVWSRSVGDGSGGMVSGLHLVLGEDALFAASADGSVFAIDPKNGATIWRAKTKARVISGPTVADDKVYVGTLDGELIALARADGKPRWRAGFTAEIVAPVAVEGNLVVVRTIDGREFGLSAEDGSRIWNFDGNEPNLSLRGMSAPLIVGGKVYTGLDSGKLAALTASDGLVAWQQNISVPSGRSELERLTDIDANLLWSNLGLIVVTYGNDIALLDPANGDSRWRRSIKSYSGLAADDRRIFVTDDDGLMWALDPETGGAIWKQDQLKYRRLSAPGVFGKYVLAGDFEGWLHWFDPDDGRIVARTRHGHAPVTCPPVADDSRVYVMDAAGRLAAYQNQPVK